MTNQMDLGEDQFTNVDEKSLLGERNLLTTI